MHTIFLGKALHKVVSLNDEDGATALEIANNFKQDLGPEAVEAAEYDPEEGLVLWFDRPFGIDQIAGIHFHTTNPEIITEILEMFQFGLFEETFGTISTVLYFHRSKELVKAGRR